MAGILRLAERATPMHTLLTLTEVEGEASTAKNKGAKKAKKHKPVKGEVVLRPPRVFKTVPPNLTRVKDEAAEKVLGSLAKYAESLLPERRHFLRSTGRWMLRSRWWARDRWD